MGALPAPTNLLEAMNGMPLPQSQDLVQGGVNTAQGRNGTSLVMHGRVWQVGSGASTTSIPILDSNGLPVLMSASMQALYTNAKFEIIQAGTVELAVVTAVGTNGTLTLDSPLSSAPSAGTAFLLTPTQQTSLSGSNITDSQAIPVRKTSVTTTAINNFVVAAGATSSNFNKVYTGSTVPDSVSAYVYGEVAHSFSFQVQEWSNGQGFKNLTSAAGTTGARQILVRSQIDTMTMDLYVTNNDTVSHTYNGTYYEWTR